MSKHGAIQFSVLLGVGLALFVSGVMVQTASAADPYGWFDGVSNSNCSISGWVYDPDESNSSSFYEVWRDALPWGSGGTKLGVWRTDVFRPDANQDRGGIGGNHGFNISLADAGYGLRDGKAHNIHVIGLNLAGSGGSVEVNASPKSITCSVVAPPSGEPKGTLDEVNNSACSVRGWAFDPDNSSASSYVKIFRDGGAADGVSLDTYLADKSRPDVNNFFSITGNHGFDVSLNDSKHGLRDGKSHPIYIYALNLAGLGGSTLTSGSPKNITCSKIDAPFTALNINGQTTATITEGDSVQLSWSSTNSATSCTASGAWSGSKTASSGWSNETVTPSGAGTFNYYLQCSNAGGAGNSASVTVTVNPKSPPGGGGGNLVTPPGVDGGIKVIIGKSFNLNWATVNVAEGGGSCNTSTYRFDGNEGIYKLHAGAGWGGTKPSANGTYNSFSITTGAGAGELPVGEYRFEIFCLGSQTEVDSVSVTVTPPPPPPIVWLPDPEPLPETHYECQGGSCVQVSAAGVSWCLPSNNTCGEPPVPGPRYSTCVANQCVEFQGDEDGTCSSNADCQIPELPSIGPAIDYFRPILSIPKPPVCNVEPLPPKVLPPQGSDITWECNPNVVRATLSGAGIGTIEFTSSDLPDSSYEVRPVNDTTYTFTYYNYLGFSESQSMLVTVFNPFIKPVIPR